MKKLEWLFYQLTFKLKLSNVDYSCGDNE